MAFLFEVCFDARFPFEAVVNIVLGFCERLSKYSVVAQPVGELRPGVVVLLPSLHNGCDVHRVGISLFVKVSLREEKGFNRKEVGQQSRLIRTVFVDNVLEGGQLPNLLLSKLGVFLGASQVPHLDFLCNRDAHRDEQLGSAVDSDSRLVLKLFKLLLVQFVF